MSRRLDPLLAVVAVVAAGVGLAAAHDFRSGLWLVCAGLALGAALRLLLRPGSAGLLVVRSRRADVTTLLLLAAAAGFLAVVTPFPAASG